MPTDAPEPVLPGIFRLAPPVSLDEPIPWPEGVEPSEDLERAYRLVQSGEPFLFVTGKAGTGKSTFVKAIRQMTSRRLAVVAPTGVAAMNAGGQTIHSFFRLRPGPINLDSIVRLPRRRLYEKLELLIIDEVSMVRADLLDAIERFLRLNGPHQDLPFGGVQIVAVGDLYQLPPVISDPEEARLFAEWYETEYFFSAHCLMGCPINAIELKKIYRQSDSDFIDLLNKIREGSDLERAVATLNKTCARGASMVDPKPMQKPDLRAIVAGLAKAPPPPVDLWSQDAVTLSATNAGAERINEMRMKALPGEPVIYEGTADGTFDVSRNPPAPFSLVLKEGAQVMFTRNDPMKRWVNGDVAFVREMFPDRVVVERQDRPGELLDVERSDWESIRYSYDEKAGRINSETVGAYHQFPLMPAWAVTIHKSQGRTIERIVVDFGRGAFAHGQVYVALSRCRDIEGLRFERPLRPSDILCDERVKEFHSRVLGRLFR